MMVSPFAAKHHRHTETDITDAVINDTVITDNVITDAPINASLMQSTMRESSLILPALIKSSHDTETTDAAIADTAYTGRPVSGMEQRLRHAGERPEVRVQLKLGPCDPDRSPPKHRGFGGAE
jgi:hypothetical protein